MKAPWNDAPAERLAALRIALGVFVVAYFVLRLPVFLELRERTRGFDGVGIFAFADGPIPTWIISLTIVTVLVAGVAFTLGYGYRVAAPVLAVSVLVITSYRSSWGQMLHFENLFTLHLLLMAFAPAADVWAMRARGRAERPYGWFLHLAAVIVVVTYVIAGIAKLRYGGIEWMVGDALRNHVAYSAVRLDVLGGTASPLAELVVAHGWLFPPMAVGSVVVELVAPIALLGGRWRTGWVLAAWLMHIGIFALMLVGFPYPIFLVAFAPFFRLERLVNAGRRAPPFDEWLRRTGRDGASRRHASG